VGGKANTGGGGDAAMNFLEGWDLGASYSMELLHRSWLTPVMRFITWLGNDLTLAVVAALAALFFALIGRWRTSGCVAAMALAAFALETNVKKWVNRSRPDLRWVDAQDRKTTPSFPSGHATGAMAIYGGIALSLAAGMRRRGLAGLIVLAGFALALLIAFSRMYLGLHYMSDVVGGLCAGLSCALFFRWVDQTWTVYVSRPIPMRET
jgi:undecaprenyl-diphosphatase